MAEQEENTGTPTSTPAPSESAEQRIGQFYAKEGMTYVDSYRSAARKQADILKEELELKQKRMWESGDVPKEFYAELRALEDALRYVTKGDEPGWVVLGDPSKVREVNCDPKELERCQKSLAAGAEERSKLEEQYKKLHAQAETLQVTTIRQRQEVANMRRRLEQSSSTFMVVVATMFLVILVQLYLLWSM